MELTVWAPAAERVDLVVGDEQVGMRRRGRGWWSADAASAHPGARYGFRLDGGPVRPDPRSASQPDGVDGLSEIIDHDAFAWHDQWWRGAPLRGATLYELHVGTFTPAGTFDGVVEKLPHLVELGVDAIELLPVVEFAGARGWGYDGVDLFAPHHAYGGPEGLKRLVDACHGVGLAVILDVVYNHLGPSGNHLPAFGPYFSDTHHTGWGAALNFDGPGSDEVRRFVIDNACTWLRDYHVDGLRLDAVHAIVDDSARHLLEELAEEVEALAAHVSRPLSLIAESDRNDPRYVRSREAGGYGLDAAWADEWHHALHAALTGERDGYYEDFGSLPLLGKALRQAWVYDGQWSPHRQRHHGRPPVGLAGHQFVVSTQNHDQIGNRARGERLGALVGGGRLRIAAALLLCGPFTPMLFQGEEWGASTPFQYFTDHEPELGAAVSDGRRSEFAHFGWDPADVPDPQAPETFAASKLDWDELGIGEHAALLAWHRELLALRRRLPELSDPRLTDEAIAVDVDEARATLRVRRGRAHLLVNLGVSDACWPLPAGAEVAARSDDAIVADDRTITIPGDAVAVVLTPEGAHDG